MSYVQEFFVFTALATVVVFGVVAATPAAAAERLARGIYAFMLAVGGAALIITLIRALGVSRLSVIPESLFRVLLFRAWVPLGAALATVVMAAWARQRQHHHPFVSSPYVLRALCVSVALVFFTIELGKWMHDAEILAFFVQSGLPGWFRHVVMGIELVCAIGLLLPRPVFFLPAAVVAIAMMAGAIGTHVRNGDSFEDSLDAFHLLIVLVCVLVLSYFRGWTRLKWLPESSSRMVSMP